MRQNNIFKLLKEKKKEDILFKYCEISNFDDLRLFSFYLLNRSMEKVCNCPQKLLYLTPNEKEQTENAIDKKNTNIKINDVDYYLSELGYRTSNSLSDVKGSIGVFGCSYTFGVGIPYDKTFTHLLQENLGKLVYNFGIPGSGIQKITKSFCSINSFYKLKTSIFVLPSIYRYEFLKESPENYVQEDLIPNYVPQDDAKKIYNIIYSEFGDITFFNEFTKNIYLIKLNAKLHNTKVYFTTWCKTTKDILKKYNLDYFEPINIRFLESEMLQKGEKVNDFARDGMHPGLNSHEYTYTQLYNMIKNTKINYL